MSADVRMEIAGVRMDVPTGQPVVVLRELDGPRRLPIWLGTNARPRRSSSPCRESSPLAR